ncbi:hypothetical protein BG22_06635 [Bifidobacterium sp. UTBIF-78]|nr:hypothetical protein BG22_06635 [Bifidobacterium sp. UTBIF-78]
MNENEIRNTIRRMAGRDASKAQALYCLFAMERFLERVSRSDKADRFVVKGGVLVQSKVGVDSRATLDIDSTICHMTLDEQSIKGFLNEVIAIPLDDGMSFEVKHLVPIRDEAEYPGLRAAMLASFSNLRIPFKIDFSTGEVMTPSAVLYDFPLLFGNRSIPIHAYNTETVLAEKIETILSRGIANTRMRDFYDIIVLPQIDSEQINYNLLMRAFERTNMARGNRAKFERWRETVLTIQFDSRMNSLWNAYRKRYDYARDYAFSDAIRALSALCEAMAAA